jgi:hypothetical protein
MYGNQDKKKIVVENTYQAIKSVERSHSLSQSDSLD